MTDTIFISIASMADSELIPTVLDILEKAEHPENLTLSIFVQDEKSPRDQILKLTKEHKAKLKFGHVGISEARGVGYARHQTQLHLNPTMHKYYLQIDSHTRFIQAWDTEIVNDYTLSEQHWGNHIYSVYPWGYEYRDGKVAFFKEYHLTSMDIVVSPGRDGYFGKPRQYQGNEFGELTGFHCGGFAFGYSSFFYNNKYPPKVFYDGEEAYMSITFYRNGVKVVAPNKNYIFHDYNGVAEKRRFSSLVFQDDSKYLDYDKAQTLREEQIQESYKFLDSFFFGYVNGLFDEEIHKAHLEWAEMYVTY